MITDDELWKKCLHNEPITNEDLDIQPNLYNCHMTIDCGGKVFHTDGKRYYDNQGNQVTYDKVTDYIQ